MKPYQSVRVVATPAAGTKHELAKDVFRREILKVPSFRAMAVCTFLDSTIFSR
jgi:hypothetical protein